MTYAPGTKAFGVEPAQGPSSLGHMPDGKWAFDESVTSVFDDMLARSIPQLPLMRELVSAVASHFVQPGTHVIDLGCSLGETLVPLVGRFGSANRFIGIEVAAPMLAACRTRFATMIEAGIVDIREQNLRDGYPAEHASVTLSILALMFTPIEYRFRILNDIFNHTLPNGALVIVEKVLGGDARTDALFVDLYHQHKRSVGYTQEEIDRKRLALEGVLVPVTSAWNEQLLRGAGFSHVECFWRCLNFSGWLAIKD